MSTTLPFAVFDEFGKSADDRVQDAIERARRDAVAALIYRVESTMSLEQAPAEDFNAGCYVVPVKSVRMAMEKPLSDKAGEVAG